MLHTNDRFVTLHNKCSKDPTVNLDELYNSCAKIACCSSELIFTFLCADSSIRYVREQFVWCIHIPFVSLSLHPTPQTKI